MRASVRAWPRSRILLVMPRFLSCVVCFALSAFRSRCIGEGGDAALLGVREMQGDDGRRERFGGGHGAGEKGAPVRASFFLILQQWCIIQYINDFCQLFSCDPSILRSAPELVYSRRVAMQWHLLQTFISFLDEHQLGCACVLAMMVLHRAKRRYKVPSLRVFCYTMHAPAKLSYSRA